MKAFLRVNFVTKITKKKKLGIYSLERCYPFEGLSIGDKIKALS